MPASASLSSSHRISGTPSGMPATPFTASLRSSPRAATRPNQLHNFRNHATSKYHQQHPISECCDHRVNRRLAADEHQATAGRRPDCRIAPAFRKCWRSSSALSHLSTSTRPVMSSIDTLASPGTSSRPSRARCLLDDRTSGGQQASVTVAPPRERARRPPRSALSLWNVSGSPADPRRDFSFVAQAAPSAPLLLSPLIGPKGKTWWGHSRPRWCLELCAPTHGTGRRKGIENAVVRARSSSAVAIVKGIEAMVTDASS